MNSYPVRQILRQPRHTCAIGDHTSWWPSTKSTRFNKSQHLSRLKRYTWTIDTEKKKIRQPSGVFPTLSWHPDMSHNEEVDFFIFEPFRLRGSTITKEALQAINLACITSLSFTTSSSKDPEPQDWSRLTGSMMTLA